MPREIEIKFKITDEQLHHLQGWLQKNAEFKGQLHHVEYYLNNPAQTFFFQHPQGYKDASNYFRVRFTDKGDSVCLKCFDVNMETGRALNIGEYETEVADGKMMLELLRNL